MAASLTWRSVAAPNFSGVTDAMNSGRQALNTGLTGLADQSEQQMVDVTDRNTQAMLQRIQQEGQGGLGGLSALDALQTEVAPEALQEQYGRGINSKAIFDAMNTQRGVAQEQAVGDFNEVLGQAQQTGDFSAVDAMQQQLVSRLPDASAQINAVGAAKLGKATKDVGLSLANGNYEEAEELAKASGNPQLLNDVIQKRTIKQMGDLGQEVFASTQKIMGGADSFAEQTALIAKIKENPRLLEANPQILQQVTSQINQASVQAGTISETQAGLVGQYVANGEREIANRIEAPLMDRIAEQERRAGITEGRSIQQEFEGGDGTAKALVEYNKNIPEGKDIVTPDRLALFAKKAKIPLDKYSGADIYAALMMTQFAADIPNWKILTWSGSVADQFKTNLETAKANGDADKSLADTIQVMKTEAQDKITQAKLDLQKRSGQFRSELVGVNQARFRGESGQVNYDPTNRYSLLPEKYVTDLLRLNEEEPTGSATNDPEVTTDNTEPPPIPDTSPVVTENAPIVDLQGDPSQARRGELTPAEQESITRLQESMRKRLEEQLNNPPTPRESGNEKVKEINRLMEENNISRVEAVRLYTIQQRQNR